ncbi:MAG: metallophosphoesterase [Abditibacteriota bacterium]|nr:metallophosphoesterase [Abditibacteriota bacterium]
MKKLIIIIALIATALAPAVSKSKTVAQLNPEFESRITAALKPKIGGPRPMALFYFSDLHGDQGELARLAKFYNDNEKYFAGAICVGDIIERHFESDFSFWGKTKYHEKIMLAIGNHDGIHAAEPINWEDPMPMADCYNRYFAPYIKGWGVQYEEGKTYYYKDFEENKVRLVVVDCMLRSGVNGAAEKEQLKWFKNLLADARVKGLSVIVARHFALTDKDRGPENAMVTIECNFMERGRVIDGPYKEVLAYMDAVDEFKKAGGDFVCWFCGHTHCDYMTYSLRCPDQLCIGISNATRFQGGGNAIERAIGTRNEDLADALVIDTARGVLKRIRIGANVDSFMTPRNCIGFDYRNMKVLNEF